MIEKIEAEHFFKLIRTRGFEVTIAYQMGYNKVHNITHPKEKGYIHKIIVDFDGYIDMNYINQLMKKENIFRTIFEKYSPENEN